YHHVAKTDAQRARVADWVKAAYLPKLEALGYQRKPGESEDDSLLRSTLAGALAFDYKLPAVRAALLQQGEAALKKKADGRLDLAAANPDLLGDALGVAVQTQGKSAVDALIAELPQTSDPALRNGILGGLASVEDPALAEQVRDFAISKPVKVGEMASLLRSGRGRRLLHHRGTARAGVLQAAHERCRRHLARPGADHRVYRAVRGAAGQAGSGLDPALIGLRHGCDKPRLGGACRLWWPADASRSMGGNSTHRHRLQGDG